MPCFPATGLKLLDIGRSKYHDYYVDATTCERWEHVYNGSNMLIEIIAPDASTYMEATYPPAADAPRRPRFVAGRPCAGRSPALPRQPRLDPAE